MLTDQTKSAWHVSASQPDAAAYSRTASTSSTGDESLTPVSSFDLEKGKMESERNTQTSRHDFEKGKIQTRDNTNHPNQPSDSASIARSADDEASDTRLMQEQKALNVLLFLAGPCVILSFLNTIWACISLIITLLTQPIRLCARRPTFGQQLSGLLGPPLNLQLRAIYTPLPPHANEDGSYHACMLVLIHLLSPVLSLGMMIAAWVVAAFWVSSMVVGDPAGIDKRDDGRETVMTLRGWWEGWFMRGVQQW